MGRLHLETPDKDVHIQCAFVGKDNPIAVILMEDEREFDFSTAKSIRMKIGNAIIDSETDAAAFDRSEAQLGRLKVFIGDLPVKPQAYIVRLEITDAENRVLYFGGIRVKIEDPGM